MNVSPLRYFLVVHLHPGHQLAVLAGVAAVGLWTVAMSPGELDSALGMLLFVQMFLASTGFLPRARRGHFDPVLTSAAERHTVVIAHCCASALPGAIAWAIVAGADWAAGGAAFASALAGRRLAALLIVSAMAWIAGFALARGAAGALWTAGLVTALLHRSDLLGPGPPPLSPSVFLVVRHAAAVVACPFLLLGTHAPLVPGSTAAALFATAVCLLAAWRSSATLDVYLRERT